MMYTPAHSAAGLYLITPFYFCIFLCITHYHNCTIFFQNPYTMQFILSVAGNLRMLFTQVD